jgi:uncharacterized protein YjbI with pentapeptide repeats
LPEDEALAALLVAEDVETFNDRRTDRSRPELFAVDLAQKKLTGVDLSNANLEKADLTGADLTEATLMKANLGGIDGSGMKLRNALGLRARFKDAWMDGADLTGADLTNADFADANLERSVGPGVKLAQARLRGVKASGARWPDADLSEAKCPQADFTGADLSRADLTEAVFAEADLTGAVLEGAAGPGVKLPGAKLVRAKLAGARLPGANLAGANLTEANLAAADLSRANLAGANLTGASLRGAVLADANLEGAIFAGADLREADLTGLDPGALGLDAKTVEGLAASGVDVDIAAVVAIAHPSAARAGPSEVVVWDNADAPEKRSVRFAVHRKGAWSHAVVPVTAEGLLDRQVVSGGGGTTVVVTRARPDGAVAITWAVGPDGALGRGRTVALGYEPLVPPAIAADGDRLLYFGLARRGPTLVIHDLSVAAEGELARPLRSDKVATAVGFIDRTPVLACKGGVVVRVTARGPSPPRRTPEGFPGTRGRVVPLGDDLLAVWALEKAGPIPGGLRTSVIGPRHAPREEVLSTRSGVVALAVVGGPETATIWWAERGEDDDTTIWRATVPDGTPEMTDGPANVTDLVAADGVIVAVLTGGAIAVLDPETGAASDALGG